MTKVHLIGIGGIGMSGLALLLHSRGYMVTGSDQVGKSALIEQMKAQGIMVYHGHDADHVDHSVDIVVYSSVITPAHAERQQAEKLGVKQVCRAQMLAELLTDPSGKYQIEQWVVVGTHGKTTTSSLLAHYLLAAGVDITYVIGGEVKNYQTHVHCSHSPDHIAVIEADESDGTFQYFKPDKLILTNIDHDHLESYQGDFAVLKASFRAFCQQLMARGGMLVACIDDPAVQEVIEGLEGNIITYGLSRAADCVVSDYQQTAHDCTFKADQCDWTMTGILGQHFALNATAAWLVAKQAVDKTQAQQALARFMGVGLRFDTVRDVPWHQGHIDVIADYGHHPREIEVTLAAVRRSWPHSRCVMVFQPHKYSRTRLLMQDFAEALASVDQVILLPMHTAGESFDAEGSEAVLAQRIEAIKPQKKVLMVTENTTWQQCLDSVLQPGDVLLFQGAGKLVIQSAKDFLQKQ